MIGVNRHLVTAGSECSEMVYASDYDRLAQECDSVAGKLRTALLDKAQIEAERDTLAQECERLSNEPGKTELRALKFIHQCNAHVDLYQEMKAERDAAIKQVELLREALDKISAYAPCSGVKDPGFTKMYMGILARDAIAALQAKP